jgi:hypothetical protein
VGDFSVLCMEKNQLKASIPAARSLRLSDKQKYKTLKLETMQIIPRGSKKGALIACQLQFLLKFLFKIN